MSDESIKEVAVTVGKGIDLANNMGSFMGKFVSGPIEQMMGIWEDKLKYRRWENQLALMRKAEQKMKNLEIMPTRQIPLKIAIPLFEYAAVEDDGTLQESWANLLVNAVNSNSGVDLEMVYVELLKSISPLEAKILQAVYSLPYQQALHNGVTTSELPETAKLIIKKGDPELENFEPPAMIKLAISNLDRLGCLSVTRSLGGGQLFFRVNPTLLGKSFVEACTLTKQLDPISK